MNKELKVQGFVAIAPDEGMWLTDGAIVSDAVFTPNGKEGRWRECTAVEANAIRSAQKADVDVYLDKDY